MWKLFKTLPKTWRHKVYTPLGSTPCPEECPGDKQESTANDGTPEVFVGVPIGNEAASQLIIDDRESHAICSSPRWTIGESPCPFARHKRFIYSWWCEKALHIQTCKNEYLQKSHLCDIFYTGLISLFEKKFEHVPYSDKDVDHRINEKLCLRLYKSLTQNAWTSRSLHVGHSVLQNDSTPTKVSLSGITNVTNSTSKSNDTNSTAETSKCNVENEELLCQLEDIAAEYTSHILNSEAKQLVRKNQFGKALELFNAASDLGMAEAKYNMGVCYESGIGMTRDLNKAIRYFEEAASGGHSGACYNLAVFHLEGKGVPVNKTKGINYMLKASDGGIREAHTFLGVHYGQHGEYKKAVQYFEKAVEQLDPDGEYYLGLCYDQGVGVEENMKKAVDLYKKAASAGNAEACYMLGTYYEDGLRGVHQDKGSAIEFYEKAASIGHPLASERLELMFSDESDDDYIVFEDDTSSTITKAQETPLTLRTTKSSPELSANYYSGTNEITKSLQLDFSLVKQFIEQLTNLEMSLKISSRDDRNESERYSGLSRSLNKLSSIDKTPSMLLWDSNPPKSSLVTMQ